MDSLILDDINKLMESIAFLIDENEKIDIEDEDELDDGLNLFLEFVEGNECYHTLVEYTKANQDKDKLLSIATDTIAEIYAVLMKLRDVGMTFEDKDKLHAISIMSMMHARAMLYLFLCLEKGEWVDTKKES